MWLSVWRYTSSSNRESDFPCIFPYKQGMFPRAERGVDWIHRHTELAEGKGIGYPAYLIETLIQLAGWRGARVADSDGLENRCPRKGTVGSNPTLSAT